jgi:hypothetical protein
MDRREILNDNEESLRLALENMQSNLWTCLPAIIERVDLEKQTIEAQPTIQGQITDEEGKISYVNMPLLVDVPICFPKGGGYAITFPLEIGDEVLVVFSSRCIDGWWQNGGITSAPEFRMHDLSDGFAILAPTSQPLKLSSVSSNSFVIRDNEGTKKIEISGSKIYIKSDANIELEASSTNISSTGSINLISDTSITLMAPDIYLDGDVHEV